MKKIKELPSVLAEKIELPPELFNSAGCISVSGGKHALVEDCRGILEYSEECITLAMKRGKLSISGTGMMLRAMNAGQIVIVGRINTVEWS